MLIPARSISLHAAQVLRPGVGGRVLAGFERVCDLVTDSGEVVALVWSGIRDGPLNVVLPQGPGVSLPAGAGFEICGDGDDAKTLSLESPAHSLPIVIDLSAAVPWNPQPDWDRLWARRGQIAAGAKAIAGILAEAGWTPARCGLSESLCAQAAGGDLMAVSALVGLGPGLTPAGDDWLAGWLLAQRLNEGWRRSNATPAAVETAGSAGGSRLKPAGRAPTKQSLKEQIVEIAADRTTTLSRALLACAAAGEADAEWHALLAALAEVPLTSPLIYQSTGAILSHGATSGAAMLAGFCAGLAVLTPDACSLTPGH